MRNDHPTRICRTCGEIKTLTDFPVYDNRTEARRHSCHECNDKRVRRWHRDNAEHVRIYRRAQYWRDPAAYWTPQRRARANELARVHNAKIRADVLSFYGFVCACCGEAEARFLTVDHVNNDGKEMRKIHGTGSSLYRWLKKNSFPAGFQTLCMNCNFGKAMNNGVCPHKSK